MVFQGLLVLRPMLRNSPRLWKINDEQNHTQKKQSRQTRTSSSSFGSFLGFLLLLLQTSTKGYRHHQRERGACPRLTWFCWFSWFNSIICISCATSPGVNSLGWQSEAGQKVGSKGTSEWNVYMSYIIYVIFYINHSETSLSSTHLFDQAQNPARLVFISKSFSCGLCQRHQQKETAVRFGHLCFSCLSTGIPAIKHCRLSGLPAKLCPIFVFVFGRKSTGSYVFFDSSLLWSSSRLFSLVIKEDGFIPRSSWGRPKATWSKCL